jgi:redox-sensitive bicupin YhaK (pirin superfamily)
MVTVVSPVKKDAIWINQDAELSIGYLKKGKKHAHKLQFKGNGIYAFVIEGAVKVNETILGPRDAVGYFDLKQVEIESTEDSKLLLIEIPKIY